MERVTQSCDHVDTGNSEEQNGPEHIVPAALVRPSPV